jgi:formate hydrogenlyase subunit 6/NADH:ubiquinone oxidoreductase subunit I
VPATVLDIDGLDALIGALRRAGYTVLGPTVRDGAVVTGEVATVDDLPRGVGDDQQPGGYRLRRRDDGECFGFAAGPHSPKQHLFPPQVERWRARIATREFTVEEHEPDAPATALLGVRACDLRAIAVQDRVFLGGAHPEPDYAARRSEVVVVAVQCGAPAATCFCTAVDAGPRVGEGADVVLTELLDGGHRFVAEPRSARGERLLAQVPGRPATVADAAGVEQVVAATEAAVRRTVPARGRALSDLLAETLEHPRWDDVAQRCLACTNCTLVCPTCFCSAVDDHTLLDGQAVRTRRWDSCFTLGHSYLHGGSVHESVRSRYRQWLTHKFGTWWDQFGESGCTGCGRCITWCPAAIDVTEELHALAAGREARP